MKQSKKKSKARRKMNIYAWTQKNKKVFAGTICIVIVLGMLVGLLQG